MPILWFCFILIGAGLVVPASAAEPANLALGRPVKFAPAPNYQVTAAGGTDAADLTDGKVSARKDQRIWGDKTAVGYSYPGLVQMQIDLGKPVDVGEVAIRLLGGSAGAGTSFPTLVDLVASDDGVHYHRVAGYSRWNAGDPEKYGVPAEAGASWVHKLRFTNVNIRARYVGIAFYGTAYCASDEIYVYAGDQRARYAPVASLPADDFTMAGPRVYFHKPVLMLPTNMNAPTPVGMIVPAGFKLPVTVDIDLPPGVRFAGGNIGGRPVADAKGARLRDGFTRYEIPCKAASAKDWSRVYFRFDAPEGRSAAIRYRLRWKGSTNAWMKQPVCAIKIGSAPQPRRIMAGLCWWRLGLTREWPDALEDFRRLGFNTLPVFGHESAGSTTDTATIGRFRAAGFKVLNIDSTLHVMRGAAGKRADELACQVADKNRCEVCPSYRGELYHAEVARVADECACVKADYFSADIEIWTGPGLKLCEQCARCQADYKASGAKSWAEWQLAKGEEMWRDIADAIRRRAGEMGVNPPEIGVYDFRPGINYQNFWPYDRLYPAFLGNSQVSTYSPLYPYNITFVGDEARQDRRRLPRTDVMPWICPGDAGMFPGEMFTWALLECYANGSRGVHFWSGRVWDAETLDAHARALRMIAPVENVIMDGDLATSITCRPAMRVSGMRKGNEMFLLITDSYEPYSGPVIVTLPGAVKADVIDLDTGQPAAKLDGQKEFALEFKNQRARAVHVKPI
ncbi:discoidin domain-containing protein [bacterium]|nr:discoidin domain-containing protein [bacterium]